MQDSFDRPGLPYGVVLTHDYPRATYLLAAGLVCFVAGIVFGVIL